MLVFWMMISLFSEDAHATACQSKLKCTHVDARSLNMSFKKAAMLMVLLVLLLATATTGAQEPLSDTTWTWLEAGLTFERPADWVYQREQNYEFVLVGPPDPATNQPIGFIWLQTGALGEEESLETLMSGFAERFGSTATPITFGGVEAFRIDTLNTGENADLNVVAIGYPIKDGEVGLLSIQGSSAQWETMTATVIDPLLASAQVIPLELDTAALNSQLQTSLAQQGELSLGDPNAPVTVTEVLDYSCPHCVEYGSAMDRIIQDYVQPGKAQLDLVFVTFVGQEFSEEATHAMLCATGLGRGWDMHELLLQGYMTQSTNFYTQENMRAAVEAVAWENFDLTAYDTCVQERTYQAVIDNNATKAEGLDVTSTPSLLYSIGNAFPEFMKDENNEALRGGMPLAVVYPHLDTLVAEAAAQ